MPANIKRDRIILSHPSGSSAEILLYGATVISWKSIGPDDSTPSERLFVSGKAATDGSKPVRGGIPVVYPCFGAPTHPDHMKLPQHGYLRNNVWQFDGIPMDNEAGVTLRLTMAPNAAMKEQYSYPVRLQYVVTLAPHQLSTDLHVKNVASSDSSPMEFQALFHNYFRCVANDALVYPLKGLSYLDKTEATPELRSSTKLELRDGVDVKKFTDSVYLDGPKRYTLRWPGGEIDINTNLNDVVVWNPQQEAGSKIGDMEDGGWDKYVCVEPGTVRGFITLPPGENYICRQTLTVKV
ncbi:galactose mutarotase-like protein [Epithele typhae]|uniref:galactose mutarotase-like protein n=1 Tax=Epithele typhae TaxID=378194 RepID=UPI002007A7B6|nr:galactose mutarotase-like protein [Epithele typhae]KAH9944385.1 galactose mutarotase-like protein [Epithele typhae]